MVLIFPFWLIIHPALMFGASFCPGFANRGLYQKSEHYGEKVKKHFLIGERSSRFSFTFANGLLHFLIFLISVAAAYWLHQSYINQSIAVKNKNLNIEIEDNSSGHIPEDSTSRNQLGDFIMSWANEDSVKMNKIDTASNHEKNMVFHFRPITNDNDTTFFTVKIHADFDLKFDTAEIRRTTMKQIADRVLNYEIKEFGEIDGKYYIVIDFMSLPKRDCIGDETSSKNRDFSFIAKQEMFEDDDPPYVNYYIHFGFDHNILDLNSEETPSNNELCFSYWDSFSFLQKDSKNISNYPYFNVPYELIDAKPEPETNHPYSLIFGGESFKSAIQRGVYLKFVNRDLLQQKDRDAFFYSVMFGALFTFILTVLIELLTKWRNLNLRSGNKDPYSDN